ncbi:hypothetical protein AB4Y32_15820 [Paraburkholderia phymatum]|uniref:Uncharacterized protein n=1 Tax=Paraburkholderia phymatum TaxID=148447 RepID=A0ACC6U0N0_9BURK
MMTQLHREPIMHRMTDLALAGAMPDSSSGDPSYQTGSKATSRNGLTDYAISANLGHFRKNIRLTNPNRTQIALDYTCIFVQDSGDGAVSRSNRRPLMLELRVVGDRTSSPEHNRMPARWTGDHASVSGHRVCFLRARHRERRRRRAECSPEEMIESSDLMHTTLQKRPFSSRDWIYEWKYDGFRCLVRKHGAQVDLISREGKFFNGSFPEIVEAVAEVSGDCVLDAELAVGSARGRECFASLQQRARTVSPRSVPAAVRKCPARLYVFDMLMDGKEDMRGLALTERKERLRDAFDDTPTMVYVTDVETVGELVFEQVLLHDFEGMVCKRKDSAYLRGRTHNWIKVKNPGYSRPEALGWRRK